ncbi:MAG: DUF3347 domain-containing protein [Sediminibacterium sp.]
MKKLFILIVSAFLLNAGQAQKTAATEPHLLAHYFELKDALVNSDAVTASYKITDVINALNGSGKISAAVQKKMTDAGKDLEKQRIAFAALSIEMYSLVKKEKTSADTVYQQYCPMKKMYWLSKEAIIRNPYYGKMMLSCGNLTDTIKP